MKNNLRVNKSLIFLMLLIILLGSGNMVFASDNPIVINYFTTDACLSCSKTNKYVELLIMELKRDNVNVELVTYNITDKEDEELFVKYNNFFNIKEDKYKLIPAVFVGEDAMIGSEAVETSLEGVINHVNENPREYRDIDVESASSSSEVVLTTTAIIIAGLIDGINPCSIAMMLFFISFLFMTEEKDKKPKVLLLGTCFVLGTFVAYLGIGIGLFNFIYTFSNINLIMKGFYILLAVMGIYLACLNVLDYMNIKKGKEEKIKNQLSRKTKRIIHGIIKKFNNNDKVLYFTAFITAFCISFLEFFCTGQIYLPVITYMIKNTKGLDYIMLLILYNIAFVIPLITIIILMNLGKEVIDVSTVLVTKLHLIKLIGAFFFVSVAIYSIYQVMLM